MKLKGLAGFSIALMALAVAPQAARDFREFLGSVAQSAQSAYLRAVLNSESGSRGKQNGSPVMRPPISICSMKKPQRRVPAPRRSNGASWTTARSSSPSQAVAFKAMEPLRIPGVQLASFDLSTLNGFDNSPVSGTDRIQLDALVRLAKSSDGMSEQQQKKLASRECLRKIIKSVQSMDKVRTFRDVQHNMSPLPVIKANWTVPVPVAKPVGPGKAVAFIDSPEIASDGE
jgi:hypothetical protein